MTNKHISVKNTDHEKRIRKFLDGSERNVVQLPSMYIGKGHYKPGWRWSKHAGAQTGKQSTRHIGYILSGKMKIKDVTGKETTARSGDIFEVGPNHDAWVIGDQECIALDFELK